MRIQLRTILAFVLLLLFAAGAGSATAQTGPSNGDDGDCGSTYVVQAGDWLHRIARRCDTTAEALLAANPDIADANIIHPGQELAIPQAELPASVNLVPNRGPIGTEIEVTAVGFAPDTEVQVGIGRAQSEPTTSVTARTNESGTAVTTINLPENAEIGEPWVVLVSSGEQSALSDTFTVTTGDVDVTATTQANLNFRPRPALASTPMRVIPSGTSVPVLGRDENSEWLLVGYLGQQGWIAGWLTDISGDLSGVPLASGEEAATPMRDEESLLILEPAPGSRVTSPVRVSGISDPAQHQQLEVRLLAADGSELAQAVANIDAELGERGPYEVELPFAVDGEQQAFVQVLNRSARDGAITDLNSVGITLSESGPEEIESREPGPARVTIYEPAPRETVSGGVVSVSGFGLAAFEQTLVVEVQDESGNVVGTEPVMVQSTELGEPGPFSADVSYDVTSTGPGRVVVREPSAAFDGDTYVTSVEVMLEP